VKHLSELAEETFYGIQIAPQKTFVTKVVYSESPSVPFVTANLVPTRITMG
jgi:hypothetical protein